MEQILLAWSIYVRQLLHLAMDKAEYWNHQEIIDQIPVNGTPPSETEVIGLDRTEAAVFSQVLPGWF